jgi:pyrimidine-specific ribonucleoside hydrolase
MSYKRLLVLFPLLLFAISQPQTAIAQNPAIKNVIISTDLATGLNGGWRAGYSDIDDGMAVAMAYFSGQFNILGVVVTFGNNYMEPEFQTAKTLIQTYMGTQIPVVRGASVPFNNPPAQMLVSSKPLVCSGNEGVEFMHTALKSQKAAIIAIGPLTDVACLVAEYPGDKNKIEQVVVIMGRAPNEAFTINGVHGLTDFNMRRDSAAVAWLLNSASVPVTFIGFSVTKQELITSNEVKQKFGADPSQLSQFFLTAANNWITQWKGTFKEDGFHAWDQNAVYYLMNPQAYVCSTARYEIVSCGPPNNRCAGQSSGWSGVCPSPAMDPNSCTVQMYSPMWADSQGEHDQLWLTPTAGVSPVAYCSDYTIGGKKAFHDAVLNVLPTAKPQPGGKHLLSNKAKRAGGPVL